MIIIKDSQFIKGLQSYRPNASNVLPEVAIIGRSNVGKSSFINRITNRKNLARASATPGRTQQLNYFQVKVQYDEQQMDFCLVDLPGYGFAKLSHKERFALSKLNADYLQNSQNLKIVCLLNDCRREPEEEELFLRDLAFRLGHNFLVVLTKIDKLKKNDIKKQIAAISKSYNLMPEDLLITGEGIKGDEFYKRIKEILRF